MLRLFFLLSFQSLLFPSEIVSPKLGYCVHDQYLKNLHSVFLPLNKEEKETNWGKEHDIANYFAKELDLYQAITAFKRASIMIDDSLLERRREIDYQIINCYYLGGKYKEAVAFFDQSLLANIEPSFVGFHDLLIILHDSFSVLKKLDRAKTIANILDNHYPHIKQKLAIAQNILEGDIDKIKIDMSNETINSSIASLEASLDTAFYNEGDETTILTASVQKKLEKKLNSLNHLKDCQLATSDIYKEYTGNRKSPFVASSLNAIIPGMGYLYLGQKQSAITALLLNSFTTAAAYYFYSNKNIPAALLTLSFESGWYFGGIYGVNEEATFYNKRCFEKAAHYRMRDNKLYPILMLTHGF